jgi:hypothetical protein
MLTIHLQVNPLKPKRERQKRKWVGSARHYTLHLTEGGGNRAKFAVMKVSRRCPLVLLVKVGWKGGKTFGCEEGINEW